MHVEFGDFQTLTTDADVVVVAGDVHVGRKGRAWLRENFSTQPVVYVLGNHEFYRHALPKLTEELERESEGGHIHVLENRTVEIGGIRFLGCTLWSDFKVNGDAHAAKLAAEETMSDYHLIRVSPEFRKLRARDTELLHARSVEWLKQELATGDVARTVVVTHHAPSALSTPPYHRGSILNGAFVSDLDALVMGSGVPLWIHGHTHHCVDYRLGSTRILSNQRGYPDSLVEGFQPSLVVVV